MQHHCQRIGEGEPPVFAVERPFVRGERGDVDDAVEADTYGVDDMISTVPPLIVGNSMMAAVETTWIVAVNPTVTNASLR